MGSSIHKSLHICSIFCSQLLRGLKDLTYFSGLLQLIILGLTSYTSCIFIFPRLHYRPLFLANKHAQSFPTLIKRCFLGHSLKLAPSLISLIILCLEIIAYPHCLYSTSPSLQTPCIFIHPPQTHVLFSFSIFSSRINSFHISTFFKISIAVVLKGGPQTSKQ